MNRGAVLVVPVCEPGRGGGHLIRCMTLVNGLRTLGRDSWLFLPVLNDAGGLLDSMHFDRNCLIDANGLSGTHWECIVLDRFQTSPEELARWTELAPVIGIDEGGISRDNFDFLIDILPNFKRTNSNIADPSLLPLPEKPYPQDNTPAALFKVLISFGQEDAAGLGPVIAKSLAEKNNSVEITLLQGGLSPLYSPTSVSNSPLLKITGLIPNLNKHLHEYNLVITHYGLTAFEALYADVPVLLVSPGAYHEKLAKKIGFYSLGIGKNRAKKLNRVLFRRGKLKNRFLRKLRNRCSALAEKCNLDHTPRLNLAELINGVVPDVSRNCPVCGAVLRGPALARYAERTYLRCTYCGIISMNRLNPPPIEYAQKYFFEQYQKQYGKTYIEDFPNLTALGRRRLAVIKSLLPAGMADSMAESANAPSLLDIGCAYGPFLAAAREEGFSPCGIEPAEDAVRYVTQTIGIPAVQGFFPDPRSPLPSPSYSVVTLWYVIEHFRDCVPVLAEIRKLLKSGGILAFATPSFSGISGRSSLKRFLEHSPADHWTIWSPAVCIKTLKMAGFTVKKIVNSGHHPERFPLLGKLARSTKSPLYGLLLAFSTIFSLGDTFEVYAVGE